MKSLTETMRTAARWKVESENSEMIQQLLNYGILEIVELPTICIGSFDSTGLNVEVWA